MKLPVAMTEVRSGSAAVVTGAGKNVEQDTKPNEPSTRRSFDERGDMMVLVWGEVGI